MTTKTKWGLFLTLLTTLSSLVVLGCTEKQRAKNWGGTVEFKVPEGNKVIDVTWKGTDLWVAYRPMRPGETAETVTMEEDSSWGTMEGKVIFKESGSGPELKTKVTDDLEGVTVERVVRYRDE